MKKGLSKSRLIAYLQCPRRMWLQAYKPEASVQAEGVVQRLQVGDVVGNIAQDLFPGGVLATDGDLKQGLRKTKELLVSGSAPIYEAAFSLGGLLVLADLLIPTDSGWRMIEVKSSSRVKAYHIQDATIQTWVAQQSGIPLSRTEIGHIDTSFVYPGGQDYQGLLAFTDISEQVKDGLEQVPCWVKNAQNVLSNTEPETDTGEHCNSPFECPFKEHCGYEDDKNEEYPIEILPYGGKVVESLRSEGFGDLRSVPKDRLDNPRHLRVWEATKDNKVIVDQKACSEIRGLPYPRYYIDFETIQLAVPVWSGTRPYSQIPFQWSCHIENSDGEVEHFDFLGDGRSNPRREFAETLIDALGCEGPVIVYNAGFERGRLKELADVFPDLSEPINRIIARIFDLLPFARQNYYHPDMMGSWSIKSVLPTIAPELSYTDLEVGNGGMAMEAFAEMMVPDISEERYRLLTEGLLKYCELDTWAMVVIARYFEEQRANFEI